MNAIMQDQSYCGIDLLWDAQAAQRLRQLIREATGAGCCTDDSPCMWAHTYSRLTSSLR